MSVTKILEVILADSYALYLKTQNYHWNVTCPEFRSLHLLFENQYKDLAEAIDELAERIRILGTKVVKMSELIKLSSISEADSKSNSTEMLKDLVKDQQIIIDSLNKGIKIAQKSGDEGTADIFIQCLKLYQKNQWMLASSIK
ncbi:MAG: DNA starvation/stationary phase protection protein [Rickettsia endosymbiont of Bryobia graminum]|nr:DNA starvation/stationary phase protection protein [Rickettsia endosymbiont of Bryobia graminum]